MNDLEFRYRSALRWYSPSWRAANADAVVGTLLERAEDEKRTIPARGELGDLRVNAMRERVGRIDRVVPLSVRSRAAVIAIALAFTVATAGIAANVWKLQLFPGEGFRFTQTGTLNVSMAYYGVWVLALVAALVGLRRFSAALVAATLPIAIVLAAIPALRVYDTPDGATVGFLELLGVLYILGLPTATRRVRGELGITTGVFLVVFAATYWLHTLGYWGNGARAVDYFWAPFAVWLTLLGLPAAVVASIILWRARRSPWAPAMLLATVPVVALSLIEFNDNGAWLIYLSEFAAVALLVGAILGLLRIFGLRIRITRV